MAALGDLDGDSVPDLAVGAYLDDDGTNNQGAVYVLFLNNVAPAAPTGLTATPGDQQINLDWTPNSEADFHRYRIYGGATSGPTRDFKKRRPAPPPWRKKRKNLAGRMP